MLQTPAPPPLRGAALVLLVLFLTAPAFAQSGRTTTTTPTPAPAAQAEASAPAPTPDHSQLERLKLVNARGFDNFVKELNEQGRSGYRLDKSVGYGGRGPEQSFAAVLRLDPGHSYEYEWFSSPNRDMLDARLNAMARQGFNYAASYALTACDDDASGEADGDPTMRSLSAFKFMKGNVYLLERRDGGGAQSREYRFFTGKIGPGKNPKEALQAALDKAQEGFRPVKVLFSKTGWLDFRVSLLLEKDLTEAAPAKFEYQMVKEMTGFEKEVNKLAAEGFRFVAGGRMGSVKFAVLAKQAADATAYTFIADEKHAKEFDKTVAAGNAYHGVMAGTMSCDDWEAAEQKLVFARSAERREYKIVPLPLEPKTGALAAGALADFRRLAAEGHRVRDIFYARGLNVIFEK